MLNALIIALSLLTGAPSTEGEPKAKGLGEVCQTHEDCRSDLRCVEPHQHAAQQKYTCQQLCSTDADCTAPEFADRVEPYCNERGVCS